MLLAGLAAQAPTAAAATRAPQGALAINPFAGSINLAAPADISSPYSQAVLADHPTVYYRLDETEFTTAEDSSGNGLNGMYVDSGARPYESRSGALVGDADTAVQRYQNSGFCGPCVEMLAQSGNTLPAGNRPRTLEAWINEEGQPRYWSYNLFEYGDVAAGHGFTVNVGGEPRSTITVSGATQLVHAVVPGGLENSVWHLIDITYEGGVVGIYADGALIGGGSIGNAETVTPGQGLKVNGGSGTFGLDEVAIYPSSLSATVISAHWNAASEPPAGSSIIAGEAVVAGQGAAPGARIQACPSSGGACQVDPWPLENSGHFHMLVANGTYTVTIFTPAGSPDGPKTFGPLTLPPSALNLSVTFSQPGGLPEGVSLSSPGRGTQEKVVPGLNWGEPSSLSVSGCKHGFGAAYFEGTNANTGASETRAAALQEEPAVSGQYVAHIAPPAPIHGLTNIRHGLVCPDNPDVLPDGGPAVGGTTTLITGSGFTEARAVLFGTTPAVSFHVLRDNVIEAVSPSGAGTVSITVRKADGSESNVGSYSYFGITNISTESGPSEGGTPVVIHGYGFTDVKNVAFGLLPATSFKVVNSGEIEAVAPPGVGIVDVQVANDAALSDLVTGDFFRYTGTPPAYGGLSEGTAPDAISTFAVQLSDTINGPDSSGGLPGDLGPRLKIGINCEVGIPFSALGALGAVVGLINPAVGAVIAIGGVLWCLSDLNDGDDGHAYIDPSGAVLDGYGSPIAGATATLLDSSSLSDPFIVVEPLSGAIEPAENPELTGSSGQFDWNALAGAYEVEASAPGCHAPGEGSQPDVFTSPFVLPPPVVGLMLTLECEGETAPTPRVTGLSVSGGATSGGNVVDILGEGLAGVTSVQFGGNASVHVQPLSPYAVAAVAPAGAGGTVDVTVSGPGDNSATAEGNHYTYSTPVVTENSPVVESVAPSSGPLSGDTVVTIKGSHLAGAFSVEFDGTPSTQVTPVSGSEVQAVAPAAAFPARVDITVTTSAGGSAPTLADSFVYGSPPPPVATSVTLTPSPNPVTAGQPVGLTAFVAPTDGGGTVAFYADGSSTPIDGCGPQTLSQAGASYQATCSTSSLAVGNHTLSAAYSGDVSYAGSSGSANLLVSTPESAESTGGGSTREGSGGNSTPTVAPGGVLGTKAASGRVLFDGSTINVPSDGQAAVKLTCASTATCSGKLTLIAKTKGKSKKKAKTQTIGTASFSIPAGRTVTIKLKLNGTGRTLLSAAHGHLNASLTILRSSFATQTNSVHLVQQKATKAKKSKN